MFKKVIIRTIQDPADPDCCAYAIAGPLQQSSSASHPTLYSRVAKTIGPYTYYGSWILHLEMHWQGLIPPAFFLDAALAIGTWSQCRTAPTELRFV